MGSPHPLAVTAARADALRDWLSIRFEESVPDGWLRCRDVDENRVADWEARVAGWHGTELGRTHPQATSGYVLGYYADIAPTIGALFFLVDRRVPSLARGSLAFHTEPTYGYADGAAVLAPGFWCLPGDVAADHPDAIVVADEEALADVLRAQVRMHADDFLASFRPSARLPRQSLLGSFYDALDAGFDTDEPAARVALPGPTPQFAHGSSYYLAVDGAGGEHLTRRRVSCCYYFKVGDDGACTTCPRLSDEERACRLAGLGADA